jgi:two-component system chemotaxis sensor kinase CheA
LSEAEGFFDGFIADYFAECEEHLSGATRALLELEESIGDPGAERAAIDELFRIFHTIKGNSAMVDLRPAEQLAHHLEHYLRAIRERELFVSADGVELLIQGAQRLEQIIAAHRLRAPQPAIDDVVARVAAIVGDRADGDRRPASPPTRPAPGAVLVAERRWRCTFAPSRELLAQGIGVDTMRKRLTEIGAIVAATPEVRPDGGVAFQFTLATPAATDVAAALAGSPFDVVALDEPGPPAGAPDAAGPKAIGGGPAHTAPSHVVRVDLTRLDELMRNVGDLVITRARLTDSLSRVERHVPPVEWRTVHDNAVAIDRQLRTLREGIMRVRLVPIGEIFRRMPFVVRDLARETGKKVTLHLQGQSTEIDKYLIERMMDPVLHLVRNAVSHGIEPPDIRIANGKRPEGAITLGASTAGETVTIEVADDGHGIDAAAVAARARTLGLPAPPDAAALLALLCAPGFSTRDDADRASGRGVGMAVVKQTIEQLSGSMTLETEPGAGARFLIQLPLTLAIADALIGRVGSESFAIPQSAVREVIEVVGAEVRRMEQNEIVPYRNGALPIVRLGRLFGIEESTDERFHVFVIGAGAAAVGLAVDRIVGQREIVVRAIVDPLVRVDGISGATDLGDGRVVLILDPVKLTHRAATPARAGAAAIRARVG